MQTSNSSHCQLFQLHIDAYLDNELEAARKEELLAHVARCAGCRQELDYAEHLHRAVASLPLVDCPATALEPVDRLFSAAGGQTHTEAGRGLAGMLTGVTRLLQGIPLSLRLAVPVLATFLVVAGITRLLPGPDAGPEVAGQAIPQGGTEPEYSQAEIVQALQDLELALDYLERISERTEVMIEDRFLLRQLEESINASFTTGPRSRGDGGNGPI